MPQDRSRNGSWARRCCSPPGAARDQEEQWELDDGVHTYLTVKFPILDAGGRINGCAAATDSLNEVLKLIAEIDEFRGAWVAIGRISRSLQLEPGKINS